MKPSGLPTSLGLLFAAAATVSGSHFDSVSLPLLTFNTINH